MYDRYMISVSLDKMGVGNILRFKEWASKKNLRDPE